MIKPTKCDQMFTVSLLQINRLQEKERKGIGITERERETEALGSSH